MGGKLYLGELEHIVLAAILSLQAEAYGAGIINWIADTTGKRLKSGSLYVTLDRLEAKGYIRSRVAAPDTGRGGRPKRYVTVTRPGLKALKEAREAFLSVWRGLEAALDKVQ